MRGNLTQTGPARILTIPPNTSHTTNVTLDQDVSDYAARLRSTEPTEPGRDYGRLESPSNTAALTLQHVVYTCDDSGMAEGIATSDLTNWNPTWKLGIANEFTNNRP